MKRKFALLLALVMVLLAGCGTAAAPTTQPETTAAPTADPAPETTAPVMQETQAPTQPTEESTEPTESEYYALPFAVEEHPEDWKLFNDDRDPHHHHYDRYIYTGDKTKEIVLDGVFSLKLPEEWADKVEVLFFRWTDFFTVEVHGKAMAEALEKSREKRTQNAEKGDPFYAIWTIMIQVDAKRLDGTPDTRYTIQYRGEPFAENDEMVIYVDTQDSHEPDYYPVSGLIYEFIVHEGEEAYEEAMGQANCTYEEAVQMIELLIED